MKTGKSFSLSLLLWLLLAWGYDGWLPRISMGDEENGNIIITADEIREMNAHKMADVLNHVPGVSAGDSSVSIHGSYKVKVFVDGRPINDPTSGYGGVNWELVTPGDVARIEIMRGKGGMRYGKDASGGVILITTKRVRKLTGNAKAYGGNHETGYGYANVRMTSGKWTLGATGGYETTGGYKINNDKERYQCGAKLGYRGGDKKQVTFLADYLEDERGLSGTPAHPTPDSRKTSKNTNLSFQAVFSPVTSVTSFNEGRTHNIDVTRDLDQTYRVTQWVEDLSAILKNRWGDLSMGGGYELGKAEGSTFDNQTEHTISLFSAQTLKLPVKPLTLCLGVRANINSEFDNTINPEVKAMYKKERWRTSVSYTKTDNTPSFRQRYNRTSSTDPNPDLDMETSDNFNLGVFITPVDRLSLSLTFFHNRLNDRITYVTDDETGMCRYENFSL